MTYDLGRYRVEVPVDLVGGATHDNDDVRARAFGVKLLLAGGQELGRNLPVPPLEAPLHVRVPQDLVCLLGQVPLFGVQTLAYRLDGLRRQRHRARDVADRSEESRV